MNKQDVKDWKSNPVTKKVIHNIHEAVDVVKYRSNIRDTAGATAMAASYGEGFMDGVKALLESIDELEFGGLENED